MKKKVLLIGGLVLLALIGGLVWYFNQAPEWTEVPEGFVEVDDARFAWKAVSPDGSVIAIRTRPNEGEGGLEFWREVFELEMVEGKGYRLVETEDVVSADGVDGSAMRFEFAQGDTPFHYGLAVYVTSEWIVTLETATELEALDQYAEAFDSARGALEVLTVEAPGH